MAKIKFSIHPLFFLFGVYYAVTGRIFMFLIFTFTAVIHELGHLIMAEKLGYGLNKIKLMPFGAVISGDLKGLKLYDETLLAFAGPLLNLFISLIFTALWWVVPEIYAFTDVIVMANTSLAVINFIPAYPLDGGRIAYSILAKKFKEKTAIKVVKVLGFIFGISLFVVFLFSLKVKVNFSILFFAIFIICGVFEKNNRLEFLRILNLKNYSIEKGLEIKKYAVTTNTTIKKILSILDYNSISEIVVFSENYKKIAQIDQKRLMIILENANLYDKIEKFVV